MAVIADNALGQWLWDCQQAAEGLRAAGWELADILNAGIGTLGGRYQISELYRQAAEVTGLNPKTLQNMVSTVRAFPPEKRHDALPISFHSDVAGLPDLHADALLLQAEEQGWTRERLRAAAVPPRGEPGANAPRLPDPVPASGNEDPTPEARPLTVVIYAAPDDAGADKVADAILHHYTVANWLYIARKLTTHANEAMGTTVAQLVDDQGSPL